jgi:hypothetical protein
MSSHAEIIDLVCTDATGFSSTFSIDTSRGEVLHYGHQMRKVWIDKNEIAFVNNLEGKEWFHSINRTNGNMSVQAPDKTILHLKCESAKPKF